MSLQTTVNVWLTNPAELVTLDLSNSDAIIRSCYIEGTQYDYSSNGWLKLGSASLDLTLSFDQEAATQAAVKVMQDKINEIHAKAYKETQVLQEGINKLLAIGYDKQTVAAATPFDDWQDVIHTEGWKCIKTGCGLTITSNAGDRSYWGDLFQDLSTSRYLFNLAENSFEASTYIPDAEGVMDLITADGEAMDFEPNYRNFPRLFVFHFQDAKCNTSLENYLESQLAACGDGFPF